MLICLDRFSGLGMSDVSTPLVFGMFEIALRICASTSAFADWLCRPRTRARRRACAFSADGPEKAKTSRANMLVSAAHNRMHCKFVIYLSYGRKAIPPLTPSGRSREDG